MVGIVTASEPLLTRYLVQETTVLRDDPVVIVDLGARGGFNTEWRAFGDHIRIYGFEPDERECARLNAQASPGVVYLPWTVGGRSGTATFYETKLNASSGLYKTDMDYFGRLLNRDNGVTVGEQKVAVRALEEALASHGVASFDFLKLDVEGAELDVLQGAASYLKNPKMLGLLSEIRFQREINGSPGFAALDNFVQTYGLRLYGLDFSQQSRIALPYPGTADYRLPTGERFFAYTTHGQIQDGNALYFRDLLIGPNAEIFAQATPAQLLKLASLFEIYCLNDCAAELIQAGRERLGGLIDCDRLLDLLASGIAGRTIRHADYVAGYFAAESGSGLASGSPRISVVTPAIDSSIFIDEAVASVGAQDYRNVEHIVVYDGSEAFATSLRHRHPHLNIIRGSGTGPTGAGAAGIAAATGEFVIWLNSDDWLLPGAFHRLAQCAAESPAVDIWTGDCRIVTKDEPDRTTTVRVIAGRDMTALTLANILDDIPLLNARFCRRTLFDRVGPVDLAYAESSDREWLLRAKLGAVQEASLGMFVSEMRMHEGSRTINGRKDLVPAYIWEHIRLADQWLSPRAPASARRFLRSWRAREILRSIVFLLRAGRYLGAAKVGLRECVAHPFWPVSALSAFSASRRRHRTAAGR
ncbi:MAG TPA: FkbM family methyltransferase [Stellaceae bacterium]|jgi:FkbM family methyltransferase|nr:FkbM family methyltransferase [Stellaceae bacterium]